MHKLTLGVALAAGLTLASGCASTSRPTWSRPFAMFGGKASDQSTELAAEEKPRVSEEFKAAQKILKKDPEGTILAYARLKEDNEEFTEARDRYREMLIAYPENIDARLGLARIELRTGRARQAEEILQMLATQYPHNLAVQLQLGQMYVQREDWESAIRILQAATHDHPKDQTAAYELGLAYARNNQLEKAVPHLSYAVGESAAMYNLGYILFEQGRSAEAARWFQDALQNHPDERTAHQSQQMLTRVNAVLSREGLGSQLAGRGSSRTPSTSADGSMTAGRQPESAFQAASWSAPAASSANMPSSSAYKAGAAPADHAAALPARPLQRAGGTTTSQEAVPEWTGPAPDTAGTWSPGSPAAVRGASGSSVEPPGWRSN